MSNLRCDARNVAREHSAAGAGAPPGSSTRAPWWKVPTRWAMLQPHLSLPRCRASEASTFRTSDCEIPNSRAIRGGAIPALKAARTAFTWPRVSERTACAGRTLEDSFFFRDLLVLDRPMQLPPDQTAACRVASPHRALPQEATRVHRHPAA